MSGAWPIICSNAAVDPPRSARCRLKRLQVLSLLALLAPAAAAVEPSRAIHAFYGFAYDLNSGDHLYTEVHRQVIEDSRWVGGVIAYYTSEGELFGDKTLDLRNDPFIPVYRLELSLPPYAEGIVANGDEVEMIRQRVGADEFEQRSISKKDMMTADSGFHGLLLTHFEDLLAGETLHFRMAVPGNLDSFKFRAHRIDDARFEGAHAVRFKIELDSFFRLLIDPLELTYDPDTRDLLEYRGVSNLRDPATGEMYVTRIVFPAEPPPELKVLPPLEIQCKVSYPVC